MLDAMFVYAQHAYLSLKAEGAMAGNPVSFAPPHLRPMGRTSGSNKPSALKKLTNACRSPRRVLYRAGTSRASRAWTRVRAASRSLSPPRGSIRFRLALRTYDAPPWGVRVVSHTKSRKIPTRNILPLFFASRDGGRAAGDRGVRAGDAPGGGAQVRTHAHICCRGSVLQGRFHAWFFKCAARSNAWLWFAR